MKSRVLLMTFLNEVGKKVNVRIPNIKEELSEDDVAGVMDTLISSKAIIVDGSYLSKRVGAKITTQSVDKINL